MAKKQTKKSRRPFRRYTKKHRYSTAGKILPPLDVRSSKHLKEFERRLKSGPITIVLVYADWCGHCHTMMPHFDAASKSPKRSIQSVKVNEQMLNSVNDYINRNVNKSAKPIEVEGYPSIILVNNKGDKISDIEPVRDTSVMTKVMNESGNLAEKSGFTAANVGVENMGVENIPNNNRNNNRNSNKNRLKPDDMLIKNEDLNMNNKNNAKNNAKNNKNMNNGIKKNSIAPSPLNSFTIPKETDVEPDFDIPTNINKQAETLVNVEQPIEPPTMEGDMIGNENNQKMVGGKRGGSLIGSISQAAYTLATPAALLATAAYVMKNSKKTRRIKRHKQRKSMKRKSRR